MSRRKHPSKTWRRRLTLEPLQSRRVMAGNVMVNVVGNDVTITGDTQANGIFVSYLNGDVQVQGVDLEGSATTVNGGSAMNVVASGNLTINLGDGDDKLGIGQTAPLTEFEELYDTAFPASTVSEFFDADLSLPGELNVDLGNGSDIALIRAFSPTGVTIDGGADAGNDIVLYRDNTTPNLTATNFSLNLGDGDNVAGVALRSLTGAADITSGTGADEITVVAETVLDLDVASGDGADTIKFSTAILGNGARFTTIDIDSGDGNDEITGLDFGAGTLTVAAGEGDNEINLRGLKIGGPVTITAGSGNDELNVSDFFGNERPFEVTADFPDFNKTGYVGGNLVVNLGDGNQSSGGIFRIVLGARVLGQFTSFVVTGDIQVTGGTGQDNVLVQAAYVFGNIISSIGDGGGMVAVNIAYVAGSVELSGGSGVDHLSASAFTIGGNLRMTGQGNNDSILVNSSFSGFSSSLYGSLVIDAGDGNDTVRTNSISNTTRLHMLGGGSVIDGGSGNDTFILSAISGPYLVVRGDVGDDIDILRYSFISFVLLDGGAGTDKYTIGEADGVPKTYLLDIEGVYTFPYV